MLLSKLKKLLYRKAPITTLHWRFFFPKQSDSVKLHRYVFFQQNKKFPLSVRVLVFLFSQIKWWFLSAPIQIYKLSKKQNNPVIKSSSEFLDHLPQLLRLSYCYNIPPMLFYSFPLKEIDAKYWLDYVYDFQCLAWHSAFLGNSVDLILLDNKETFAEHFKKNNISTVSSLCSIDGGENELFVIEKIKHLPESFFCKPISSNQSKGCYKVSNNNKADQLTVFSKFNFRTVTNAKRQWLASQISHQPYIIQPLLENPKSLKKIIDCDLLVFRVVTFSTPHGITIELAQTELLLKKNKRSYCYNLEINPKSGKFIAQQRTDNHKLSKELENLEGWLTESWSTISSISINSHKLIPDHFSIGWDIAIAEMGPVVIEGNHFWAAELHQALLEKPLLKTNCCNYYLGKIT